jgi:hypothetical protein
MRYRSLGIACLGAGLMFGLAACNPDELVKVNEDPNNPTSAPPQAVFTYATRRAMQRWNGSNPMNHRGPVLTAQHLAQVQYPDEDTYDRLDATVTDGDFIGAYANELKNFQSVIEAAQPDNQEMLWGPAQVMRSLIFGYVTDIWGDVPFSEALKGDADEPIVQPAYDPQEAIYAGLFADLDEAVTAMAAGPNPASVLPAVGAADPIFGGNRLRWQRFGNSLRARHAMRLANVDAATAEQELNAAISAPGGLIASNDDNALMRWPGDGIYDNPWTSNNRGRDDHRLSQTLMGEMLPYSDPRVAVFAQPTLCFQTPTTTGCPASPPEFAGMPNGLTATEAATYSLTTSRPGRVFYDTDRFCNGCTDLSGASFPSFVMTYAEVSFILAEGAERSWIGGSAAAFYEQGIRASMEQWGVTDAVAITAFLAQPGIAYNVAGTQAERLTQIARQKYIALFTDGVEAWAEWRRTCVPATVIPGSAAVIKTVPRRYQYSIRERLVNAANVDAAVSSQGDDNFTTRMYWDSNPTAAPTYPGPTCGVRP